MKLYTYKPLNIGFSVLCPDRSAASLRGTARGIQARYPGCPVVAVVPEDTPKEEIAEMLKTCPVVKGLDTITSLINGGMNASKADWTITIMSGSHVRYNLDKKYSYFIESELDVLFPIVDGRTDFVDGTLNGIMIHKETWKAVGAFCNKSPLGICKLTWTLDAIEKGVTFKAIIGTRIC